MERAVFKSGPHRPVLALPEDERWMTRVLCEEFGLELIGSDPDRDHVGVAYGDPLAALPSTLPSAARMREFIVPGLGTKAEYDEWWWLTFLDPEFGRVEVEQQQPPPRFADFPDWPLKLQIAPNEPILQFSRSHWHTSAPCLIAGGFSTIATAERHYTAAVHRVWAECSEFDPYATFPEVRRQNGDDERLLALPTAASWIEQGGAAFHQEFID